MVDSKKIRNFKDLEIWQEAVDIVEEIYQITKEFPKEELYGIVSQMRRAAVSIPSNIAEGFMRRHNREFKQFLFIALSSSAELETQLIIANKLGYLLRARVEELALKIERLNKRIASLIKCL